MGVLRRVALPVVLVGALAYGVTAVDDGGSGQVAPPDGGAPADVAPLADGPLASRSTPEQVAQLTSLWDAWAADLGGEPPQDLPAELSGLAFEEATYVLLSLRAAQLAAAADEADGDVDEAVRALAPSPAGIAVTRPDGSPEGCVALTYDDEPLGRTYFANWPGEEMPGPEPQSELEAALLRSARVGLAAADAQTCGLGGVAYSPSAQQALRVLSPELLPGREETRRRPPGAGTGAGERAD